MDSRLKEYLVRRKESLQKQIVSKEKEKLNCRPTQVRLLTFQIAQLEAAHEELLLLEKNMEEELVEQIKEQAYISQELHLRLYGKASTFNPTGEEL